ncbi:cadmium-sensing regulator, CadC [Schinkia azotoformans MEV2011]|uniref:Cadmium-sensing regulator, CadC n=1 Tax=Schinkia azotoformans MEV2011 TaxID=1348973 RepID=A0A072NLR4_SCHAZ|nr:metalloregulator ArsR/SmtB family transcription factor [Schinkia azotoformans]KEF38421.1 cadmium-sensing regulator, CadC [Schinkia azotoformans MEV2011]MEC1694163.1 metalloregulator ArsR/SmtB family transcription factor [Schinkia azotoformans]MEC1715875.1 metalloregulator ArsR/SmtB family transcription factor [Schinkia azotoformans]MEC1724831.1 metalloregulator ArsR/SmtB family transcription factor [Schinkia azotoformans]MEC1741514.1 metalloregulator ArsR/SmtB family transcription factor [S
MGSKDSCDIYCFDEEKVNRIQNDMQNEDLSNIALVFKALADENRAKITYALCQDEELCVCDIANIIGATVATTSHHLRTLKSRGIVKFRKEGKLAFYSLDDEHVKQLIGIALAHTKEEKAHV